MSVNMQYVGFTAKAMVRGYTFLLRESSIDSHEITFTILNEACDALFERGRFVCCGASAPTASTDQKTCGSGVP
jgi:hypothetical protein